MSRRAAKSVDTMLESIMIRLLREAEGDEISVMKEFLENQPFKRMLQKYVEGVVQLYDSSKDEINPNNSLEEINIDSFISSVDSDPRLSKLKKVLMMVAGKTLSQSSVADELVGALDESIMNIPRCMVMTAYYQSEDPHEPVLTDVPEIMHDRMYFFTYMRTMDTALTPEADNIMDILDTNYRTDDPIA
jgi:hypothetical protein